MTTQTSQQSHTENSDEIDLGKLLGILLDAKWLIMLTTFRSEERRVGKD